MSHGQPPAEDRSADVLALQFAAPNADPTEMRQWLYQQHRMQQGWNHEITNHHLQMTNRQHKLERQVSTLAMAAGPLEFCNAAKQTIKWFVFSDS